MSTYNHKLDELQLSDLQSLIDYEVQEDIHTEYKSEISRPEQICIAVSSFANAFGGDLIIGISQADGKPKELSGIEITNIDQEELRISNILQNGLDPKLGYYKIRSIQVSENRYVIIIRVDRSWLRPHRVKANDKFYSRKSNGKFPLDVYELKQMFLGAEEFEYKYRKFKEERMMRFMEVFHGHPFTLIHLLPLSCFEQRYSIDLNMEPNLRMSPLVTNGWNSRINFHGLYADEGQQQKSQFQLFRNGIVEFATTRLTEESIIYPHQIEIQIIKALKHQIQNYRKLNIDEPFYLTCSFYGVKGFKFPKGSRLWIDESAPLEEDNMVLPEVLIDPETFDPASPQDKLFYLS